MSFSKKINRCFNSLSNWTKILFIIAVILFLIIIFNKCTPVKEGFQQRENFTQKNNQ